MLHRMTLDVIMECEENPGAAKEMAAAMVKEWDDLSLSPPAQLQAIVRIIIEREAANAPPTATTGDIRPEEMGRTTRSAAQATIEAATPEATTVIIKGAVRKGGVRKAAARPRATRTAPPKVFTEAMLAELALNKAEPKASNDDKRQKYSEHEQLFTLRAAKASRLKRRSRRPEVEPASFFERCITVTDGKRSDTEYVMKEGWPVRTGDALTNILRKNVALRGSEWVWRLEG